MDLIPWNHWPYNLYDRAHDGQLHDLSLRHEEHERTKRNQEKRQKEERNKD